MAYDGHVISYEASLEMINITDGALEINKEVLADNILARVDVHHALVGTEVDVWGSAARAESVPPLELPNCDVLVTDCEGAELYLIKKMKIIPRAAIIEANPNKGVETESVVVELEKRDYSVSVRDDDEEEPTVEIMTAELG